MFTPIRVYLLCSASLTVFSFVGCRKPIENTTNDAAVRGFGGGPSTIITLPITNERIDTHNYRIDATSKAKLQKFLTDKGEYKLTPSNRALVATQNLDFSEAEALVQYSRNLYTNFAALFQNNTKEPESTLLYFKAAVSAVNAMEPRSGTVYYGQSLPIEYIQSELVPGKTLVSKNFTSTSKSREVAYLFSIAPGNGKSVIFSIENSCHGRDFGAFSKTPKELEVLFPPAHPFRVVSVTPSQAPNTKYEVKLQEILPCPARVTSASNIKFPYCTLKKGGQGVNLYGSATDTNPIGALKPGIRINGYAQKNSRYEIVTEIKVPLANQECIDSSCTKKRLVTNQTSLTTFGGVSGIGFVTSTFSEGIDGVLAPGIELLSNDLNEAKNKKTSTVFAVGFVNETDFDVCDSEE